MTWEEFVEHAEILRLICEGVVLISNRYKGARLPDSKACSEEKEIPAPALRFLDSAFKSGNQSLIAAADHGSSLYRALRSGPMLSFSPWSCAREILEACATTLWLIDENATPFERYSRGFFAELQDVDSAAHYFKRAGDSEMVAKYQADAESLLRSATELGIADRIRHNRKPNISKRIKETIGDPWLYAMLSPVAHGNPRMSLALATEQVLNEQRIMITGLTVERANWLVRIPAQWIARSFRIQSELFGWDTGGGRIDDSERRVGIT